MNVAFDTWATHSRFRNSGIYLYTLNLLRQFRELALTPGLTVNAFVGYQGNQDAKDIAPIGNFCHVQTAKIDHYLSWRLWGVGWESRSVCCDVTFVPHSHVLPFMCSVPIVTTIHDATPLRAPGQMDRRRTLLNRAFLWCAINHSARIITVSERSKQDLVAIYDVNPTKIHVIYPGINHEAFNADPPDRGRMGQLQKRLGIRRPYLFHHGTVQPRKNLAALIGAHFLLLERYPSLQLDLVLAGPLGWLYEPVVQLARKMSSHRASVILTDSLPEEELALLLKGAEACVFPSLYEGFCFPMVEAMACGVPTVVSNSSCLPEVSGGALRYFDPNSIDDMAVTILQALQDSSERKRMSEAGMKRAQRFTWRQTAVDTLGVLASACR